MTDIIEEIVELPETITNQKKNMINDNEFIIFQKELRDIKKRIGIFFTK
jgi:hypothetical protein